MELTDVPDDCWLLESVQIDLEEPLEVGYWAREFGCSAVKLRAAVKKVGTNAGDVRRYLQS